METLIIFPFFWIVLIIFKIIICNWYVLCNNVKRIYCHLDQFNAFFVDESINFFQKNYFAYPEYLNSSVQYICTKKM